MDMKDKRVSVMHRMLRIVLASKTPINVRDIQIRLKTPLHPGTRQRYLSQLTYMDLMQKEGASNFPRYSVGPDQKELADACAADMQKFIGHIYSYPTEELYYLGKGKNKPLTKEPASKHISGYDQPSIAHGEDSQTATSSDKDLLTKILQITFSLGKYIETLESKVDGINERLDKIEALWK